jgi:hypothetical protein
MKMAEFLKLDLVDEEESIITTIEAKDLESLLKSELKRFKADDRLESCLEGSRSKQFSTSGNTIKWLPGDGSWPTIAVYGPNTDETRECFRGFTD